jgi:uncharacterized membrane protein
MDDIGGILLLVFVVIVLPWLLWLRSRHLRVQAQEEFDRRWNTLSDRVSALERSFKALSSTTAPVPLTAVQQAQVQSTVAAVAPRPQEIEATAATPPAPQPLSSSIPVLQDRADERDSSDATQEHSSPEKPRLPSFAMNNDERRTSWFERLKGGFDLEEALGTNWLNKIGIVILVFGIAFFLAYQLRELGPAGKDLVGFVVSGVLLGGGLFLEKKPGYSIIARAGVGGGWGLAFFTTYALYHVSAARILSSQGLDLVLMGVVAAAMVAHSLLYRSQVVTGLAFLLAFSTVTISHVTVYSLCAGVVLSIALVVIVLRLRWYELEVFGLLAAYLNHFYWLSQIIGPMNGHKHSFPEFVPSAAILLSYWLVFRFSYIIRKVEGRKEELIATASALLNTFGMLALFKYQSIHPEWAFWALLVLGSAEVAMALFARPRRRLAFVVLATIGVTLLFVAVPFRFSGMNVSLLWVAATEALLFVGIATRELVFRRLAFVATIASVVQMLSVDTARVVGVRMDGAMPGRILPLGFALFVAAIVYYSNSVYVRVRWSVLFDEIDIKVLRLISYGAMLLAAAGLWIALPGAETSAGWAFAALLLGTISLRARSTDLKIQADVLAAVAFIRALSINLETTATWGHVSQRLITVALCALALYAASRFKSPYQLGERFHVADAYTWVGSTLVGLLIWYELNSVSVAPAWALFGLLLVEIGVNRRSMSLRMQGYIALVSSVCRVFTANLAATGEPGELSARLYSIVPVIAILFYLYALLLREEDSETLSEMRFHPGGCCAWAASACLVALVRFELQPDWVVVAWAALVPLLLAIAWRNKRHLFLQQALVLTCFTAFRGAMHNLYARSLAPAPFLYSRALCVGTSCVVLFGSLLLAYKAADQRVIESESKWQRSVAYCMRNPEQVLFFAPFLLVISLLGAEMSKGLLTVSWSVFGVATFLFALLVKERSFRLAGIGLLLVGVGKIMVVDVWSLGARDRYLTFISMGTALLLVSFLYTRFREAIRQYL